MGYQQITIQGNLTRDVEVRQVGQSQVGKTGVAVTEKYRKSDGTIGENTEFFDIELWDKGGLFPYLKQGASVLVVGKIKTDRWQGQDGQNRESKKVRVDVIQLVGPRPQAQQGAPAPQYAPRPQAPRAPQPQYNQPAPPPPAAPQFPQSAATYQPQFPNGESAADDLPFGI